MADRVAERGVARRAPAASPWERLKGRLTSKSFRKRTITALATAIAIAGSIIILFPVAWMLSTSLKTKFGVFKMPPEWIPRDPQWQNYRDALTFNPWHIYFKNTIIYAVSVMIGELLSCSAIAYGFARLRAPGRDKIFMAVLATMMLPAQVTIIPRYILFVRVLGWRDSYKPLIVPAFFGSAYLIFLLRQFYMGISSEMDDASRIDGCGYFSTWWRIILPLSKPALGAVSILSFMWHWNTFMGPLLYLSSNKKYTLSLGLQMFRAPFGGTPYHWLMAASLVAVLPCVIVFFFTQRFFVQGIVITGLKG
jgi:ABC-type glycerol-3-phosphate transport system permease component